MTLPFYVIGEGLAENHFGLVIITRGIISLFLMSKIYCTHLVAPIDFTNDQNTIRRVFWGYIYTSKIKIHVKVNTWDFIIFTVILERFGKIGS